jgi:hypothetical protein
MGEESTVENQNQTPAENQSVEKHSESEKQTEENQPEKTTSASPQNATVIDDVPPVRSKRGCWINRFLC